MPLHPLAGQPAPADVLVDCDALLAAYHDRHPDPESAAEAVSFGTSGHRGTSLSTSFNEDHIVAITQALCEHRKAAGITGPLFLGKDTHALSRPAERTALEVLAANGVAVVVQAGDGIAPTPVISREILTYNRGRSSGLADGVVVTPSHNPPTDGGFKYNPPNGGPADSDVTGSIQKRANALLREGVEKIRRLSHADALRAPTTSTKDFVASYVGDLGAAIDFEPIRAEGLRIGIDPLGGSSLPYVQAIGEAYAVDITVVNEVLDERFAFMSLDHDGKIRMDCSSPHAMASLIALKDQYDVAFAMDPDADRHGIVAPSCGLMNPNHYLAVAIRDLIRSRAAWPQTAKIGKTLVSSGIIDRVVRSLGRAVYEVPVGFKWFAGGLADGTLAFGGEESAGASFLRRDGSVWTTDKDGILLGLLAAEMTARTGKDPGEHYEELAAEFGRPFYRRVDQPATLEQKARLKSLGPADVKQDTLLAGEPIEQTMTTAPGNGAAIGGLKVATANGWFAARPSGTEAIYKVYAESFRSEAHLDEVLADARTLVDAALDG